MAGVSQFTQEVKDRICEKLSSGEYSLRRIARSEGFSPALILYWVGKDPSFAEQYARALSAGTDAEFEGLRDLIEELPPVDDKGRVDAGWVQWKRLQVDTRKWQLSKRQPKKYGDKLIVDGDLKVSRIIVREEAAEEEQSRPVPVFEE